MLMPGLESGLQKFIECIAIHSSYLSESLHPSFDVIKSAVVEYANVFRAFGRWETAIEKLAERQIMLWTSH